MERKKPSAVPADQRRLNGTEKRITTTGESSPLTVPRSQWWWVERCVWTPRMLDTLEKGVEGGKWYSLIDKVYSLRNLRRAYERVASNRGAAGVDRQSIAQFSRGMPVALDKLHELLKERIYTASDVRRTWIDKPGSRDKRPLGIPTVRDRIVQTALRHVLEPIFERMGLYSVTNAHLRLTNPSR